MNSSSSASLIIRCLGENSDESLVRIYIMETNYIKKTPLDKQMICLSNREDLAYHLCVVTALFFCCSASFFSAKRSL